MSELEPFVDADKAADFLSVTRRRVLELARCAAIPGHPIGHGKRKQWRFRLSELVQAMTGNRTAVAKSGSPRQPIRRI
jgi:hypothetical protein